MKTCCLACYKLTLRPGFDPEIFSSLDLKFLVFGTGCYVLHVILFFFNNRDSLKHIYQLIKSMNGSAVNNIVYVSLIVFSNRSSCVYRWGSLFVACNKDLSLCDYYHNSLSAGQTFGTGLGV